MDRSVNVIGAGLAGLSAAIALARGGAHCNLISSLPSERAQSVLAEGGINASLDTMGENDSVSEHFADTMRGGCDLESESAVRHLTRSAPGIVSELVALGVPFNAQNGRLILRNFGGQKKKRTAYAQSSTGKMIMTALIDEARKYEASGLITRYPHHELCKIDVEKGALRSVSVIDKYTKEGLRFGGQTILCTGGLGGFFEGMTTGSAQNTGNAAAIAFCAGVAFANLEFIQYHPTTAAIAGKRMLISEAARGEGGRLFILRAGKPWYFMEEKYPEYGNLMPRDVVSREMAAAVKEAAGGAGVYLDMTGLDEETWQNKLKDLREEVLSYLKTDPKTEPVPVSPGIHYFMGGMRVNGRHETNIRGLFAAGEAACRYHGANRLGGNSMLGAICGGKTAARAALEKAGDAVCEKEAIEEPVSNAGSRSELRAALTEGLGIVRCEETLEKALHDLDAHALEKEQTELDRKRALLGRAMLLCALKRKESRGAHTRSDYPERDAFFEKETVALYENGAVKVSFEEPFEMEAEPV